jgi:Protein phosphatase 2C
MSSPFPPRQALQPQDLPSGRAAGDTSPSGEYEKTLPPVSEPADRCWRAIGQSVQGASHVRKGTVNQDAIGWWPSDGVGDHVILAVADGHGSAKNFRSATGSVFAKDVSLRLAEEIVTAGPPKLSDVKISLQSVIPRRIVQDWLALVHADLRESPLTEKELATLERQSGRKSRDLVAENPHLAYGSTLVTAMAAKSFTAFWQIGDGDVLIVSGRGHVDRPVAGDEQLIANETTSLCSPEAWRLFRTAVLGTPAPMIMVSTDGFANSFQSDEGFFKFGSDVLRIVAAEGIDAVDGKLDGWLTEMTRQGSGDDISLGIICQPDVLRHLPIPPPLPATVVDTRPKSEPGYPASWPAVPSPGPDDSGLRSGPGERAQEYPASWPAAPSPGLDDSVSLRASHLDRDGLQPPPGSAPSPSPETGLDPVPRPQPILRAAPAPQQEPARPVSPPAAAEPESGHRPPPVIPEPVLERPVSPPMPPLDPASLAEEGVVRRRVVATIPQTELPDQPPQDLEVPASLDPEAQAASGPWWKFGLGRSKKQGSQDGT